jgi:alkanesulfonate monooxygenase SsuD/methylene tetrahydromethanopterin reductase-like flavin-dependent oxidoreductase (luciferase family)
VKYGVTFPNLDPRELVDLSQEAERAGWDGVFTWDGHFGPNAWVNLAGVAARTERVRIGTMLTPVSRRKPWELAQETATLDRLSNGRLILAVGLGAPDTGFDKVGEETDRKARAALLDEGLAIITQFWKGEDFSHKGERYTLRKAGGYAPVQTPRVPIWVVGAWQRPKSMRRALRYDGLLPYKMTPEGSYEPSTADDIRAMRAFADERRESSAPYDIILEGETPGDDPEGARAIVAPYVDAGATWWLENVWDTPASKGGIEGMRARVRQGPPR